MTDILKLPAHEPRVETGVVQFGDDWPGVFIRGDNALSAAMAVEQAAEVLQTLMAVNGTDTYVLLIAQLIGLAQDLCACSVGDTGWPPRIDVTAPVTAQDAEYAEAYHAPEVKPRIYTNDEYVKRIVAMLPDDKAEGLQLLDAARRMVERFGPKKAPGEPGASRGGVGKLHRDHDSGPVSRQDST